jgi:hypothetical protein
MTVISMYHIDEIKNVISRTKQKIQLVCVLEYNKHMDGAGL